MKPTEDQIKRIKERRAEYEKRRAAVFAQFPAATAYDIVSVARQVAADILFDDGEAYDEESEDRDAATLDATAHTLALVMVALHAAGVSDSAK